MIQLKRFIVVLLLTFGFQMSHGQNVMVIDTNPTGDGDYFQLSNYLKLSLQKGQRYPQLIFSDRYALTEEQFRTLSEKFNKALPSDFFERNGSGGVFGLVSTHGLKANTSEWAYGMIEGNKVKWFVQVIVAFERTQTTSKIKAIDVRTGNDMIPEDSKAIIEQYRKRVEFEKTHPFPPPPPPKQN
jgi:hypothetical protein